MENDQQQTVCDNCKKSFPTDKIDLHEAYCFRNIKKCPKCDKMIDVNEQQIHEAEEHSNKMCEMCKQTFSPHAFNTHPENCPKKPVDCEFCQNTYNLSEINKHKEACGSRTQQCLICQKNVMIRQIAEHTENCQRRTEERRAEERRAEERRAQERRAQVSQDAVRIRNRNQNQAPSRQRQNSQNARDRKKSISSKNLIQKPTKVKPSHMIGPESIKPIIDPVPISIRLAMKGKDQNRLPLKSKN